MTKKQDLDDSKLTGLGQELQDTSGLRPCCVASKRAAHISRSPVAIFILYTVPLLLLRVALDQPLHGQKIRLKSTGYSHVQHAVL